MTGRGRAACFPAAFSWPWSRSGPCVGGVAAAVEDLQPYPGCGGVLGRVPGEPARTGTCRRGQARRRGVLGGVLGGTLVSVAGPPPATRDDIKTVAFIQESNRAQLIQLARLVDEGHLRPQVGAVYPLAQAAEAFSAKAAGGIPGRIVLQP